MFPDTSSSKWEVTRNYWWSVALPKTSPHRHNANNTLSCYEGRMSKEKFWNDMDMRKPKYSDINLSEYRYIHLKIYLYRPEFEARATTLRGHCLFFHDKKGCVNRRQCYIILALPVLLLCRTVKLILWSRVFFEMVRVVRVVKNFSPFYWN
jgi:hypothetical protein